jgi:two-component system, NarL family, response regulator DegU
MNDSTRPLIQILILDNQSLIRSGLKLLIETQPDMKVVGEVGNANEGLELISAKKPDIILFELFPPGGLSLEVIPELIKSWNKACMILVTSSDDEQIYLQAVKNGVLGIILRTQQPEVLFKAIRKVYAGEVWIEHSLMKNLVTSISPGQQNPDAGCEQSQITQLSERERQVVKLIVRGLKNQQIAEHLFISETTVRHHLTSIYCKLGVSDRLQLLVLAHHCGLAKSLS